MRKVTILTTRDNKMKELNTDAKTWGELKSAIESQGISTTDMKAMEQETRATYEHQSAVLPTGDFTLFLTPGKIKSGVVSFIQK